MSGDPWPLAWDAAAFIEEWFAHSEHIDLEEAICHLPLDPWKFGYEITDWHSRREPQALLRAHLLRIVKGWDSETALIDYLNDEPTLVSELGFEDGQASKSTSWRVWNDSRLEAHHKRLIRTIGQVLVNVAREYDIPALDEVFQADPGVDAPNSVEQDAASVCGQTIEKTHDVWETAKPMITGNYELPRAKNTEVHKNAFLEAHAFMRSREQVYAEDGIDNFAAETTCDRVHTGSLHRYHLQKIGPHEAREMHRDTTIELIKRARRDSKLVGGVIVGINITKSNPYRENINIELDENGKLANTWLLGYKDKNKKADELPDLYFQWATVQIVGLDVPLVLDAMPIHRGFLGMRLLTRCWKA